MVSVHVWTSSSASQWLDRSWFPGFPSSCGEEAYHSDDRDQDFYPEVQLIYIESSPVRSHHIRWI
jgi:hypothetical protein